MALSRRQFVPGACLNRFGKPKKGPKELARHNGLRSKAKTPGYHVPELLRLFVREKFNLESVNLDAEQKEMLMEMHEVMDQPTNLSNYMQKFFYFLQLEEIAKEDKMAMKDPLEPVRLHSRRVFKGQIGADGQPTDDVYYTLQLPDHFVIPDDWTKGGSIWLRKYEDQNGANPVKFEYRSKMFLRTDNWIELSFERSFEDEFHPVLDQRFQAVFQADRYLMKSTCEAVHYAYNNRRSNTFPSAINWSPQQQQIGNGIGYFHYGIIWDSPKMIKAVGEIVFPKYPEVPYLLCGPKGNSTMVVVVESILQILDRLSNAKILVCTDTNRVADELVTRLYWKLPNATALVLRINSRFRQVLEVSDTVQRHSTVATVLEGEKKVFNIPGMDDINSKRVIVSTRTAISRLVSADPQQIFFKFPYLFVLNATEITEPETLLSFGLFDPNAGGAVVLAGDLQGGKGPFVLSQHAIDFGYGESLMERISRMSVYQGDENGQLNSKVSTMLDRQN